MIRSASRQYRRSQPAIHGVHGGNGTPLACLPNRSLESGGRGCRDAGGLPRKEDRSKYLPRTFSRRRYLVLMRSPDTHDRASLPLHESREGKDRKGKQRVTPTLEEPERERVHELQQIRGPSRQLFTSTQFSASPLHFPNVFLPKHSATTSTTPTLHRQCQHRMHLFCERALVNGETLPSGSSGLVVEKPIVDHNDSARKQLACQSGVSGR